MIIIYFFLPYETLKQIISTQVYSADK